MKLKKSFRIYLLLWLGLLVSFAVLIVACRTGLLSPHHRLAQDPANVEKITGLDLPEIEYVRSYDNLSRSSSRWDCFEHCSYFVDSLSSDCIDQLEALCRRDSIHWSKDSYTGYYKYLDDGWNRGDIYCIACHISNKRSYIEYYVDESEGLDIAALGLLIILLVAFILVVIGVVAIVKTILRRCRTKKEQLDK